MDEKKAVKLRERRLALKQDYIDIFTSYKGKKVLWSLMKFSGFMAPSHTIGDPYHTAFIDGQKNMILHILNKINSDEEKLMKYIEEEVDDEIKFYE